MHEIDFILGIMNFFRRTRTSVTLCDWQRIGLTDATRAEQSPARLARLCPPVCQKPFRSGKIKISDQFATNCDLRPHSWHQPGDGEMLPLCIRMIQKVLDCVETGEDMEAWRGTRGPEGRAQSLYRH